MDRPDPQQLKEATKLLYGEENSGPIINAIETRERYRRIHRKFAQLKKEYPYKQCVRRLIDEFHASESLIKKVDMMDFPDGS